MIYLLVSDDSLFHRMVSETFLQEEEVWSWAGRKKNGEAWSGPGAAFYGDPGDPDTFSHVVPGRAVVAVSAATVQSVRCCQNSGARRRPSSPSGA